MTDRKATNRPTHHSERVCHGDREKAFIDELQIVLRIDDDTAARIVEVLMIKNRG